MTNPAPNSIFAVAFGQASTRAIYLSQDKIFSATASTTKGDLPYGLAVVTKFVEESVGHKIEPDEVIVSGNQSNLDLLSGKVEASFVTEDKAIAAAERALTKKLAAPTAILDLGPSAFLDRYPAEEVGRWLPFIVNLTDIENHLANKRLYPRVLPVSRHEYEIDLAVARQAIIKLGAKEGTDHLPVETKMNLVLTGGLLTSIPSLADLASVLLDSFYFKSGATIFIDTSSDLLPIGAVLSEHPDLEIDLTSQWRQIGSVLHLGGAPKLTVDFGYHDKQRLVLESGELIVLPAGAENKINVSVGGGKTSHHFELTGGEGGIYLDNRPRPLGVVVSSKDSIAKIASWRKALSGQGFLEEVTGGAK